MLFDAPRMSKLLGELAELCGQPTAYLRIDAGDPLVKIYVGHNTLMASADTFTRAVAEAHDAARNNRKGGLHEEMNDTPTLP